ncbi:MAG: four-carbon acid sugar kinase family protein, partial [Hyphomicrobiales bacterium]
MMEVAVIADDITGAADTGIQFRSAFAPVYLLDHRRLGFVSFAHAPRVLSVFTGSRALAGADARQAVAAASRALQGWAPRRVYKKIDSALRGHIGVELEAVMEALAIEVSFIAP